MAEVRSGSFNTTGYSDPGYTDHYVFSWELVSQSIVDCTSTIKWSVKGAGGTNSAYWTYVQEKYVTVNGVTQSNTTKVATSNDTVAFSGTSVIKHSASTGKGSFSASCGGAFYYYGSYNSTGKGSWDLPTIARATMPAFSATSVELGKTINVGLTPADSSFKHKLTYSVGNLSGQTTGLTSGTNFTGAGNVTIVFTVPTSLGAQFPNTNSTTCTITCYTYNSSGTLIGTTTNAFTLNVPSYTPSAFVSLTGVNLLSSTYVENKSSATVSITAPTENLYGASIKSYSTVIDGKTYTTQSFTTSVLSSGTKTATTTVTDSRGKTVLVNSSSITVYAYAIPYVTTFTLTRQSTATTVVAAIKGGFSSVNSKNAKTVKVTLNGVTNTVNLSAYTFDTTTTFTNVPTDNTLTGQLTLTDSYTTVTKDAVLPTVAVTLDFYKDGNGIAMGKVAEEGSLLDVSWRIKNGSVLSLIGGLGTSIPSSANLNSTTYINPGNYVCPSNAIAQTLSNTPTKNAFKMCVHNVTNAYADASNQWTYLVREIINYQGERWVQDVNKDTGSWVFSAWRLMVTSGNISGYLTTPADYVIEQTTSGAWTYRKWNSGYMEVYGTVSQTPTVLNNGTNSITVTLPVSFVDTNFVVSITPAKCALQVSAFGDCNSASDKTHTVNSFILSYKYNYSTAYAVNFNVVIVGNWK